jgi:hypothetical protein
MRHHIALRGLWPDVQECHPGIFRLASSRKSSTRNKNKSARETFSVRRILVPQEPAMGRPPARRWREFFGARPSREMGLPLDRAVR